MKNRKNPWVSIIACLVVQLCVGILYLWSAFRSNIVAAYGWTPSAATMVSSYMLFAFVFGNLIGGVLVERFTASGMYLFLLVLVLLALAIFLLTYPIGRALKIPEPDLSSVM